MRYNESTLRRKAYKIGYQVVKGFQHFNNGVYHNSKGERFTGYMVRDLITGNYEWDCYDEYFDHLWDLENVADFLEREYAACGLRW